MTETPDRRAQVAETLWQAAEHHIIAEWICCEPLDPDHDLCAQGYKAMRMVKALLVDDPEAWKPAPLLDAVMAAVVSAGPAPATDRAADLPDRLEAVLTERFTELGNPFSEMRRHEQGPDGWPASHPVGPHQVAEVLRDLLRRMADETPQPFEADRDSKTTPKADPKADTCTHCGNPVRRITGTLTTWWVHDPGGHEACHPQHAETSPRATPGPAASAQPAKEPFIPPAHYRRDDGAECCVHTIPIGLDSCRECRELADGEQAAAGPTAVDEVVAALQAKAQTLSVEAEEEMRRDLEDKAQVWHEAAELARRTGRKAQRRTKPQPAGPAQPGKEA